MVDTGVSFLALMLILGSYAGIAQADDSAGDAQRGEVLYDLCQQCHGTDGAGNELFLAPKIAGLDDWYVQAQLKMFHSGGRGLHPDDVGGMRMYPMAMWLRSDEDIAAVAAYVSTMQPVKTEHTVEGGDAEKGKQAYAICAACHGQDGAGNKAMNAPPLRGASDWYLVSSIEKYKAGVRGSNAKNPNSMLMRGMALSLADEQAVKDVVTYIGTLDD
jgi:cytochrome c553